MAFLFIPMISSAQNSSVSLLNDSWQFQYRGNSYMATVPGCIHTDLFRNNLIPDPFFGVNDSLLQWIGQTDWTYTTSFDVEPDLWKKAHIELMFKGLDTYADVYLNDSLILKATNMFRSWTISCKKILRQKNNKLRVVFQSAERISGMLYDAYPYRLPGEARVMTRKAQFQYGWDFAPRFLTCGIWKDVELTGWDHFKIHTATVLVDSVKNRMAHLSAVITLESGDTGLFRFSVTDSKSGTDYAIHHYKVAEGRQDVVFTFGIENPKEWWCNGYGEPFLYQLQLKVHSPAGLSEQRIFPTGIRTIELVQDTDHAGKSFYFKLNGMPVFMKGANYVPASVFPSSVTSGLYDSLLNDAVKSNFNMLRVWGGGIYESDDFYSLCDEKGILIWQDFMFACGMVPFDTTFLDNVKTEAMQQVARLCSHPCMTLFCGNNENSEGWHRWGWQDGLSEEAKKAMQLGYDEVFGKILPEAVRYYSNIPYWESSPSLGRGDPLHTTKGDAHNWFVWHDKAPFKNYVQNVPRFMSEFGFQSYPAMNTLHQVTPPGESLSGPAAGAHQKNKKGNETIRQYMSESYHMPKNDSDFVYLSQVLQAEGMTTGIEAHRMNKPYCMGSLYWQFNDCWPAVSWSSRDYSGTWKALQYFAKKAFRTFMLTVQSEQDSLALHVVSDSLNMCTGKIQIRVMNFSGHVSKDSSFTFIIKPNQVTTFRFSKAELRISGSDSVQYLVHSLLSMEGQMVAEKTVYFNAVRNLDLQKPEIKLTVKKNTDGLALYLTTDKPAKNIWLSEPAGAELTDNYFDMLPGQTYIVGCKNISYARAQEIRIKSIFETR